MKAAQSKTSRRTGGGDIRRGASKATDRRARQHGVGLHDRNQEQPLDRKRARDNSGPGKRANANRR